MRKKRILAFLITGCIVAGSVAGVSAAVKKTTGGNEPVMVVQASELNSAYFDYESSETDGEISGGAKQNEYRKEEDPGGVLKVNKGDIVKKGDVLFVYDDLQAEVKYERASLELEKLQREYDKNIKNLDILRKKTPVSEKEEAADEPDDFEDDFEDEEFEDEKETFTKIRVHTELNASAKPFYNKSADADKPGSESNPYRFLCKAGQKINVNDEFVKKIKKLGKKSRRFFEIEFREGNTPTGRLIKAWMQDANAITVPDGWKGVFDENSAAAIAVEPQTEENTNPSEETEALQQRIRELEAQINTNPSQDTQDTETEDANADEELQRITQENETLKAEIEALKNKINELENKDEPTEEQQNEDPSSSSSTSSEPQTPSPDEQIIELSVYKKITPVKNVLTDLFEEDEEDDEEYGIRDPYEEEDLSKQDFTKEELEKEIKDTENEIRELEIEIKEAKRREKEAKKAVSEKEIKAKINGVITIADKNAAVSEEEPFLQVTSNGGYSLKSTIAENMLDKVAVGDKVSVMSWNTGEKHEATITEISEYPESGSTYGMDGTNNSRYPFTALIDDENAKFSEDEVFVSVAFDENTLKQEEDKFYIESAFIIKEDDNSYVYVRGNENLLEKRMIKTGAKAGNCHEVISGITPEDYLAFPYWKNTKEGAKTYEGSYEKLYEM